VVAITSPANGDVVLPGQVVKLAAEAKDLLGKPLPAAQARWHVVLHDGDQTRTLTDTTGAAASIEMPKTTSEGAYVEALFSAQSAGGKVSAAHVDVYAPSQDGYIRSWWLTGGSAFGTLDDDRLPAARPTASASPAT